MRGCRGCSTRNAPSRRQAPQSVSSRRTPATRIGGGVPCRALRRGAPRRRRPRGREPGGASRPRAPHGGRRRGGRLRPSGSDEPGHRRHGRDARLASRRRARARGARPPRRRMCGARPRSPLDADGRAHAPPAGGADDVRAEVGGLARRRCSRHVGGSQPSATSGSQHSSAAPPERSPRSETTRSRSSASTHRSSGSRSPLLPWHTNRQRVAELGAALDGSRGRGREGRPRRRAPRADRGGRGRRGVGRTVLDDAAEAQSRPLRPLAVACARLANAHAGVLLGELAHEHERAVGRLARRVGGALRRARVRRRIGSGRRGRRHRPRGRRRADAREPRRERRPRRRRARLVRSHAPPRAQPGARGRRRGRAALPRSARRCSPTSGRVSRGRAGRAPRPDRLSRRGRGARRPGPRASTRGHGG